MEDPEQGKVIKGCGGLRKIRMPDPKRGKGTRGGARIVYLHIPEVDWIYLIHIYDKNEKDNLNTAERKVFAELADELKEEALSTLRNKEESEET